MDAFNLTWVDYSIMIVYFGFVLGIGWALKKYMKDASAFLEAGRSLPAWVTGLAFISANLGALEVIGMAASGAKYGMATIHFYLIGAIPAMIFLAIFMMPFYYGSKARSVPEYLKLRFDEKTRGFNAFSFAIMTIFASGISMYALALLMETLLGWNFHMSLFISAFIVLIYTYLGGLSSAIYNEVLQFFLIVIGFLPLVILGMIKIGGWDGLVEKLALNPATEGLQHSWQNITPGHPMGSWLGIFFGLGFVLSFGYWCTNFLVVQRAMAAGSMSAARKTPLIGAFPKMFIPFLVVVPGMIAIALLNSGDSLFHIPFKGNSTDLNYDLVIPMLLKRFMPTGVLGLGLTALMASFMSGMAGNVTAFNTVFTYDIYQSYMVPGKSDKHYLRVGQITTIVGVLVSILTAYVAAMFNNVMDFLQLIFAFINAPLFAAFLAGMFTKRATGHGAFYGLLSGTVSAAITHGLTLPHGASPGVKGGWISPVFEFQGAEMAQNFFIATVAFTVAMLVTIAVSMATKRTKTDEQLKGLVYQLTPKTIDDSKHWYQKPVFLAWVVGIFAIILTIIFW